MFPSTSAIPMPVAASVNMARKRASLKASRCSAARWVANTARLIASCSAKVTSRSAAAYPAATSPMIRLTRRSAIEGRRSGSRSPSSTTVRRSVSAPVQWAAIIASPIPRPAAASYAGSSSSVRRVSVRPPAKTSSCAVLSET